MTFTRGLKNSHNKYYIRQCNSASLTILNAQLMLQNIQVRQFLHNINVACNRKCKTIDVLGEISGSHGGEYEVDCLLGCCTV
jgi:hypothetical protein